MNRRPPLIGMTLAAPRDTGMTFAAPWTSA
jgi:hypothetical protein